MADRLDESFSYISKVENERLHFGDFTSEKFIHKLASELDGDELLLLADKVPDTIFRRIQQRPKDFRRICELDDKVLDQLIKE